MKYNISVGPQSWATDRSKLAVALVACIFAMVFLFLLQDHFPDDLSALYMAGHFFATGEYGLIYLAPDGFFGGSPAQWEPHLQALGLEAHTALPYIYPPLWAAAIAPVTELLSPWETFRLFAVIEIAALLGSIPLAWRICSFTTFSLSSWALVSLVLLSVSLVSVIALFLMQPQIIVVFLTLWAFERYKAGRSGAAGVLLAVAAMLKIAPVGFVLIFLLDRNFRALGAFVITTLALVLLGLAVAGWPLHQEFFSAVANVSNNFLLTSINFSFEVLMLAVSETIDTTARNLVFEPASWHDAVAKAIGAAALLWAIVATRPLPQPQRLPTQLICFGLLMNLFGPLGWAHYYLLQLLLIPGLIGILPRRAGLCTVFAFGALTSWAFLAVLRYSLGIMGDFPVAMIGTLSMIALLVVILVGIRSPHPKTAQPYPLHPTAAAV